jgi:hypothetical protein
LQERGHLSNDIIDNAEGLPSGCSYRRRFGSLFRAYKLIGYEARCNKHPGRPRGLSDEAMLEGLRYLLNERGRLSREIIRECDYVPSAEVYSVRFGSLARAYQLIGLDGDRYSMTYPRPRGLSKEEMLEILRRLLRARGSLSLKMIEDCKLVPSIYQFEQWFGTIMRAYELIGYKPHFCARGGAATRNKKRRWRRGRSAP